MCQRYVHWRYVLEFSSCALEVQIAAGFAAACYRAGNSASILRYMTPLTWLWGISGLLLAMAMGLDGHMQGLNFGQCIAWTPQTFWSSVVLLCCFAALCLYAAGVIHSAQAHEVPDSVHRKAKQRASGYLINF